MDKPCTTDPVPGDVIGAACPDCGHTNVVHPGEFNPAVDSCVLCKLVSLAQEELPRFIGRKP